MVDPLSYHRRLRRVRAFVEENLDSRITLEAAAEVAGMSPSHLATFFRATVGRTFHQWRSDLRLDRAEALLRERNYSVHEVARRVGVSRRTLLRMFKRRHGFGPAEYRRRYRSGLIAPPDDPEQD